MRFLLKLSIYFFSILFFKPNIVHCLTDPSIPPISFDYPQLVAELQRLTQADWSAQMDKLIIKFLPIIPVYMAASITSRALNELYKYYQEMYEGKGNLLDFFVMITTIVLIISNSTLLKELVHQKELNNNEQKEA